MKIYSTLKTSRLVKIGAIILSFLFLIWLRQYLQAFGYSLGYVYVAVIALTGFWFGILGGVIAAAAASLVFILEVDFFKGWIARDVVVGGIGLRIFVYFLGGIVLGYLSALERKKKEQIAELNFLKSKFLGVVAHDLRSPIGIIDLCAQNVLRGEFDQQRIKKSLERIQRSSRFMTTLINDLLDITMIEMGKLDLMFEECDYNVCVTENVEYHRMFADKDGIKIDLNVKKGLPRVVIDRARLDQVLNNIIENAVKYTKPGTTISVNVDYDADNVITKIIDQGPGIAEENISRIFDEFFKSENSLKKTGKKKSTGLGLAIAKKIVEGHGGVIWVESPPGLGTAFCFKLPLNLSKRG